jgi:hypothetical protein
MTKPRWNGGGGQVVTRRVRTSRVGTRENGDEVQWDVLLGCFSKMLGFIL